MCTRGGTPGAGTAGRTRRGPPAPGPPGGGRGWGGGEAPAGGAPPAGPGAGPADAELLEVAQVVGGLEAPGEMYHRVGAGERPLQLRQARVVGQVCADPLHRRPSTSVVGQAPREAHEAVVAVLGEPVQDRCADVAGGAGDGDAHVDLPGIRPEVYPRDVSPIPLGQEAFGASVVVRSGGWRAGSSPGRAPPRGRAPVGSRPG